MLVALDAAGKDGTIKHVMSGVNPQGVSVHSFRPPTTSGSPGSPPRALRHALMRIDPRYPEVPEAELAELRTAQAELADEAG